MLTAEPDGLLLHAMTSMAMLFRTLSARSQCQFSMSYSVLVVISVPLVLVTGPTVHTESDKPA